MTDPPDFERIDQIAHGATVDEAELGDAVTAAGNAFDGLKVLVSHYGSAADWRVLGYIAIALSRVAWQRGTADERFASVLSDFMATARTRYHPGTLISTLNALHGLSVNWASACQHGPLHNLRDFVLACLNHPDVSVRSNAVEVLCLLWEGGALTKLFAEDAIDGLSRRLADMAAREQEEMLSEDLKRLEGFWKEARP